MSKTKFVKLMPRRPLPGIMRTPIVSSIERIELSIEKIRLCITGGAIVDEYLNNGELFRLNLSNYAGDNNTTEDADEVVELVVEGTDIVETTDEVVEDVEVTDEVTEEHEDPAMFDAAPVADPATNDNEEKGTEHKTNQKKNNKK